MQKRREIAFVIAIVVGLIIGKFIKKAYFLGIKKYGYVDSDNVTHSTFSGVEINSLS